MVYQEKNRVESLTFGSEFVALRIATELITSFQYKLRMFGIPLDGHADVFCDNEAVYENSSFVKSQFKRKHNLICYHLVRENLANLLIKSVLGQEGNI